jgi:hypothetical protein
LDAPLPAATGNTSKNTQRPPGATPPELVTVEPAPPAPLRQSAPPLLLSRHTRRPPMREAAEVSWGLISGSSLGFPPPSASSRPPGFAPRAVPAIGAMGGFAERGVCVRWRMLQRRREPGSTRGQAKTEAEAEAEEETGTAAERERSRGRGTKHTNTRKTDRQTSTETKKRRTHQLTNSQRHRHKPDPRLTRRW